MASLDDLSDNKRKIIDLIETKEEVPQSEVWKDLDISSRTVSRLIRSLVEEGFLQREETTYEGSRTYIVRPAPKPPEELNYNLLMAGKMMSPFVDDETVDAHSEEFEQWLQNLVHE